MPISPPSRAHRNAMLARVGRRQGQENPSGSVAHAVIASMRSRSAPWAAWRAADLATEIGVHSQDNRAGGPASWRTPAARKRFVIERYGFSRLPSRTSRGWVPAISFFPGQPQDIPLDEAKPGRSDS